MAALSHKCHTHAASTGRLIEQAEEHRSSLPAVPFFIYDAAEIPGFSLMQTLDRMRDECLFSTPPKGMAHYLGEYYWLRALHDHQWRVMDPAKATVLVLPLLLSIELRRICSPWYNSSMVQRAILAHPSWRTRRSDHLLVALDYVLSSGHFKQHGISSAFLITEPRTTAHSYAGAVPGGQAKTAGGGPAQAGGLILGAHFEARLDELIVAPYVEESTAARNIGALAMDVCAPLCKRKCRMRRSRRCDVTQVCVCVRVLQVDHDPSVSSLADKHRVHRTSGRTTRGGRYSSILSHQAAW